MAFLAGNWKYVLIALLALALYGLWQRNALLSYKLTFAEEQLVVLKDARKKDAEAADRLVKELTLEQEKLLDQLTQISGIEDEAGKSYLRTVVPDSVRQLLNP